MRAASRQPAACSRPELDRATWEWSLRSSSGPPSATQAQALGAYAHGSHGEVEPQPKRAYGVLCQRARVHRIMFALTALVYADRQPEFGPGHPPATRTLCVGAHAGQPKKKPRIESKNGQKNKRINERAKRNKMKADAYRAAAFLKTLDDTERLRERLIRKGGCPGNIRPLPEIHEDIEMEFGHGWSQYWNQWIRIDLGAKYFIAPDRVAGKTETTKRDGIGADVDGISAEIDVDFSTQKLPLAAADLIKELAGALIRDKVFPDAISTCGLIFTKGSDDQRPHIDNHLLYHSHFSLIALKGGCSVTKVWDSAGRRFVPVPWQHAAGGYIVWSVPSNKIHKGCGATDAKGWCMCCYGTTGFDTSIAEKTIRVPHTTSTITGDVEAAEQRWSPISNTLHRARKLGGLLRLCATKELEGKQGGRCGLGPGTVNKNMKAKSRQKRRKQKAREQESTLGPQTRQNGAPESTGPTPARVNQITPTLVWLTALHRELGIIHYAGSRSTKNSSGKDTDQLRDAWLALWSTTFDSIRCDALKVTHTNAFKRGLMTDAEAVRGETLGIFFGSTHVKLSASRNKMPSAESGSSIYAVTDGTWAASVTGNQADQLFRMASEDPRYARLCGCLANHASFETKPNCIKGVRRLKGTDVSISVITTTRAIPRGSPIIMDYKHADTPIEGHLDEDIAATEQGIEALIKLHPGVVQVQDTTGTEQGVYAYIKRKGKLQDRPGLSVQPSLIDNSENGLFIDVATLMDRISAEHEMILTSPVGKGCYALHVPSSVEIDKVTDDCERLLPGFRYMANKKLIGGSHLLVLPPSQFQMAGVFAANGASQAQMYNGQLCAKMFVNEHLDVDGHVIAVTTSLSAPLKNMAWALGIALGMNRGRVEVYMQGYGCTGPQRQQAALDETHRVGKNPHVPLALEICKNPHGARPSHAGLIGSCLVLAPLNEALDALHQSVDAHPAKLFPNDSNSAQAMLYKGKPTRLCDLLVFSVDLLTKDITARMGCAGCSLQDVSWRCRDGETKFFCQRGIRGRLLELRKLPTSAAMIVFGRERGGGYVAVAYPPNGAGPTTYTFTPVRLSESDLTLYEKEGGQTDEHLDVWVQHAVRVIKN